MPISVSNKGDSFNGGVLLNNQRDFSLVSVKADFRTRALSDLDLESFSCVEVGRTSIYYDHGVSITITPNSKGFIYLLPLGSGQKLKLIVENGLRKIGKTIFTEAPLLLRKTEIFWFSGSIRDSILLLFLNHSGGLYLLVDGVVSLENLFRCFLLVIQVVGIILVILLIGSTIPCISYPNCPSSFISLSRKLLLTLVSRKVMIICLSDFFALTISLFAISYRRGADRGHPVI